MPKRDSDLGNPDKKKKKSKGVWAGRKPVVFSVLNHASLTIKKNGGSFEVQLGPAENESGSRVHSQVDAVRGGVWDLGVIGFPLHIEGTISSSLD